MGTHPSQSKLRFVVVCDHCDASTASVWCPSDSVFLCEACDAEVHANKIAARHVRSAHTECPRWAYDDAKSKGRLRDLPQLETHRQPSLSAVAMQSAFHGSNPAVSAVPSAQEQPFSPASRSAVYGLSAGGSSWSSLAQAQFCSAVANACPRPSSSTDMSAGYAQQALAGSLDTSVRGGNLARLMQEFRLPDSADCSVHSSVQCFNPAMAADVEAGQYGSAQFGSVKSCQTAMTDTNMRHCQLILPMTAESFVLPQVNGSTSPIPIAAAVGARAPLQPHFQLSTDFTMSDPGFTPGFLAASLEQDASQHGCCSSRMVLQRNNNSLNASSPVSSIHLPQSLGRQGSQPLDCSKQQQQAAFQRMPPASSAATTPTLAGRFSNSGSAQQAATSLTNCSALNAASSTLPPALLQATLLSLSAPRVERNRSMLNIEVAPPSVIEAKARALINSSSRQPQPVEPPAVVAMRLERPDGSVRELDAERAQQLHRYKQKRLARLRVYAEGQKKVRVEQRKAAADPRTHGRARLHHLRTSSVDALGGRASMSTGAAASSVTAGCCEGEASDSQAGPREATAALQMQQGSALTRSKSIPPLLVSCDGAEVPLLGLHGYAAMKMQQHLTQAEQQKACLAPAQPPFQAADQQQAQEVPLKADNLGRWHQGGSFADRTQLSRSPKSMMRRAASCSMPLDDAGAREWLLNSQALLLDPDAVALPASPSAALSCGSTRPLFTQQSSGCQGSGTRQGGQDLLACVQSAQSLQLQHWQWSQQDQQPLAFQQQATMDIPGGSTPPDCPGRTGLATIAPTQENCKSPTCVSEQSTDSVSVHAPQPQHCSQAQASSLPHPARKLQAPPCLEHPLHLLDHTQLDYQTCLRASGEAPSIPQLLPKPMALQPQSLHQPWVSALPGGGMGSSLFKPTEDANPCQMQQGDCFADEQVMGMLEALLYDPEGADLLLL
ncbi:hypothetical protein V8C86DRAFT_2463391 [Haematococcus lacustris]